MKKTVLGVSLIESRFLALAVARGKIQASWESPQPVETVEHFQTALRNAVRETGFGGKNVSILIEDPRFVHQYLRVPVMKPADLRLYLANKADQEKTWEGSTLWRFRSGLQVGGKVGILLDSCPKVLVDDLVQACKMQNLYLIQLAPLSAIFLDQVRSLPIEQDDVILLVTILAGKVMLVVARGDGTPLFDRLLRPALKEVNPAQRIGREITRSILFCEQQFNITISQVWLRGEPGGVSAEDVQPSVEIRIFSSPVVPDASYWLWTAAQMPVHHAGNFISVQGRMAPIRQRMRKVGAGLVAGLILTGVGVNGLLEGMLVREQRNGPSHDSSEKMSCFVRNTFGKTDWLFKTPNKPGGKQF